MKKLIIPLFLAALLFSCGKEEDSEPNNDNQEQNDYSNYGTVTPTFSSMTATEAVNGIIVANSTLKAGNPPSPSFVSGAPQIFDADADNDIPLRAGGGREVQIAPSSYSGDIAGYYLQVNGQSGYYDVSLSQPKPGKQLAKPTNFSAPTIDVTVPESFAGKEFCVVYCVYDANGYVSNTVTRCIQVQSVGGDGVDFLFGKTWSFVKYETAFGFGTNVFSNTTNIGDPETEDSEITMICDGVEETIEYTENTTYEYAKVQFFANGGVQFEAKYDVTTADFSSLVCGGSPTYTTKEVIDNGTGAWSYDATTGTFTELSDGYYENGRYVPPSYTDFKIYSYDAQNLELTFSEPGIYARLFYTAVAQ